jgi:hypothetical protein
MAAFQSIPGIDPSSVELLEAVGFLDESSLAKADVDALHRELQAANAQLKLAARTPGRDEIERWVHAVGGSGDASLAGTGERSLVAVNYELNADVAEMLETAPFALPLPAKLLVDKKLAVNDIPSAILLNRVVGDLEIRVAPSEAVESAPAVVSPEPEPPKGLPPQRSTPAAVATKVEQAKIETPVAVAEVRRAEPTSNRRAIDVTRVKSVSDVATVRMKGPAVVSSVDPDDRIALIRAPRPETNAGKNPESRRYIRGVMHAHPYHLTAAALVTLLLAIVLPLAIVSAGLLLWSDLQPELLPWVPKWLLAFPLALPVVGGAYLIWGVGSGRCKICNQQLFVPRGVNKNSKAHHVPVIGYIIPTALHLLVFRWFRCTYCGTAVRVKE